PSTGTDTHGTYFSCERGAHIQPNPGLPFGTLSLQPVVGQGQNNHLLQKPKVFMDIGKEIIQVQYRVSYNLPGTVVGDIPAPIYFVEFRSLFGQDLFLYQQIAHIPTFTQSIHMGVFYKQKMIGRFQLGTLPPIFYFYV